MTTILLIHGHPFDHTLWDPQAAALRAAGHQVIAPDLRGYGRGPARGEVTLLSDFAADLAARLDADGVTRAVVGGISMGGQIAMEFHRQFPDRVAGLVLADTSPAPDDPAGRDTRLRTAERLLAEGMAGYADEVLDKMITPYHVMAKPDVAAHVRRMMLATAPQGAAAALRGRAQRPDYRPSLAAVRVPTLVLVGAEDFYTPVADAELIHQLVAGSELVVVDNAGHLPGLEQPEVVNEALLRFLKTAFAAS
ncbi:alpha/beta fold hydrolase [Actinoplanes sp. NPDC026619]|uniref:alpha/beta fold hydrolase n=1 Tax=Actinoplanes sp. NPDC026619 TaxID=3155798 RepID=UPI0034060944